MHAYIHVPIQYMRAYHSWKQADRDRQRERQTGCVVTIAPTTTCGGALAPAGLAPLSLAVALVKGRETDKRTYGHTDTERCLSKN